MISAYLKLQEIANPGGGLPQNSPGGTYKPYAPGGGLSNPQPQSSQQIKITAGNSTFVVTYVAASKGWCVYAQQPGAAKAQLRGQPMPTLKDAFASVATML